MFLIKKKKSIPPMVPKDIDEESDDTFLFLFLNACSPEQAVHRVTLIE
jgi:hypothetical protein